MNSPLMEARRDLEKMAELGKPYRRDQIFVTEPNNPTAEEILGKGFELTHKITVSLDGEATEATVEFRLITLNSGELLIRLWLKWTSRYGGHRSFASYLLRDETITLLAQLPGDLATGEAELNRDAPLDADRLNGTFAEKAISVLDRHYTTQSQLGLRWQQYMPNEDPETARYHATFIMAARETDLTLLSMLSDSDLGATNAAEIIALWNWLKEHRPV